MNRITEEKLKIGQRIRALRIDNGMDQRALAARSGLSRAAISAYECGRICPTQENTVALASALGVEKTEIVSANERTFIEKAESEYREEAMRKFYAQRRNSSAQAGGHPDPVQASWMKEARRAASERKKSREPDPQSGATSGFIADAELERIPQFLHEIIIDQHIRRMLFLCGEYGRLRNVKKTRTPLGVAWSAEEVTA